MKKNYSIATLLFAGVLAYSGVCFGWGATGGDGSRFAQVQETAVFLNNSTTTMSAGQVVILDSSGTAGTDLGSAVTHVNAADSVLVVGVVKSVLVQAAQPVVVVTKGPIDTQCADSSDAVTTVTAVGTTASGDSGGTNGIGLCGGGTNLGIALEAGDGTDTGNIFVWVSPTGAD